MILLISLGDPNGIGPEVTVRALEKIKPACPVVLFGSGASLRRIGLRATRIRPSPEDVACIKNRGVYLADLDAKFVPTPGRPSVRGARLSYRAFDLAARVLKSDPSRYALVTAPVSKEAILGAGIRFLGHTPHLGKLFGAEPLMLLTDGRRHVALVTEHVPLKDVAKLVTARRVEACLNILSEGLAQMGLGREPITALGINPHAGEGGRLGTEERVVSAALARFNRSGRGRAIGPLPGDSAFAHAAGSAFLAMYHDQGLIAVKLGGVDKAVNITLGLPAVRTSPAHGTAYAIAGRVRASRPSADSLAAAIRWAMKLHRRRFSRHVR